MEASGRGLAQPPGNRGPRNQAWPLPHLFHFHCYRPVGRKQEEIGSSPSPCEPGSLAEVSPGQALRPHPHTGIRTPEMGLLHGVQSPTLRITQIPLLQEDPSLPPKKRKAERKKKYTLLSHTQL